MNNNSQQVGEERAGLSRRETGKRAICSASSVWQEEILKISPDGVEMCKTIVQFRLKSPKKKNTARDEGQQIEIFSKYVDTESSKHFSDSRERSDGRSTANKNSLTRQTTGRVITTELLLHESQKPRKCEEEKECRALHFAPDRSRNLNSM
jgi:hypothetical protein